MVQRRTPEGVSNHNDNVIGNPVAIGNSAYGGNRSGFFFGLATVRGNNIDLRYQNQTPTTRQFSYTWTPQSGMPFPSFAVRYFEVTSPTVTTTVNAIGRWFPPGTANLTPSDQYSPVMPFELSFSTEITTAGSAGVAFADYTVTPNLTYRMGDYGTTYRAMGRYGATHRVEFIVQTPGGGTPAVSFGSFRFNIGLSQNLFSQVGSLTFDF